MLIATIITFTSCSRKTLALGTLSPRQVKKWYKDNLPFEFKTLNTPIPYEIDLDSLKKYKLQGVSFCDQLDKDFTKVQDFYEKNFSFNDTAPLQKKAFWCGLDTCLLLNTNTNCQFTIYYLSKPTAVFQYQNAKPLEKLLIKSDTFYNSRNYLLCVRLQIDINVYKDIQTGIPKCDLNLSTTFYLRKSGNQDKNNWNPIDTSSEYFNSNNYQSFVNEYNLALQKACDSETLKYNKIKTQQ